MKKVHVAIIDDGINYEYINKELVNDVSIIDSSISNCNATMKPNQITHGTVCASILLKYAKNVCISSVKILTDFKGNVSSLCTALEWCIKNDIDIVNVSLGSQSFRDVELLRRKINEATSKGIVVICATANNPYITYPAAFSNSISVRCDTQSILSEGEYYFTHDRVRGIEIVAFSAHIVNEKACRISNSFAAPMITAIVCSFLGKNICSIEEIKQFLFLNAAKKFPANSNLFYLKPDWIVSAIVIYIGEVKCKSKANYFFDCYTEIQIDNDDVEDLKLELNKVNLLAIDTLILVSEICFSSSFVISILEYKLNVVLIHNDINSITNTEIFSEYRIWDCALTDKLLHNSEKIEREIHEPLVLFEFENEIDGFFILQEIQKLFFNDSVNAYIITNNPYGILHGFDYISDESSQVNITERKAYFLNCVEKKQADILLFSRFIDTQSVPFDEFKGFDNMDLIVRLCRENKYKCETKSESTQSNFAFDYIDCNSITLLYEYIIGSFEG